MNNCFMKMGTAYRLATKEALDLHDVLPGGNYMIKANPMTGELYLDRIDDFVSPAKVYGNVNKNTGRILSTYLDRPSSTGVILAGEKGSGKTLLARNISMEAAKQGIPTVVINSPLHGDQFNEFVQKIEQPCIFLFDEFEKVYDDEDHEKDILTLFDGVFPTKKLWLLTCNDKWSISGLMRNRPGRIFYMLDFNGVDIDFIIEYCKDNLKNQAMVDTVAKVTMAFDKFNFDMLKALVEEMNRYDETPQEAIKILNVKPEYSEHINYTVKLSVNGVELDKGFMMDPSIEANPLMSPVTVTYIDKSKGAREVAGPDGKKITLPLPRKLAEFLPTHIKSMDVRAGKFVMDNGTEQVMLERVKPDVEYQMHAF